MAFAFNMTDIIPATPQQIYDAWLDSHGHSNMTGSPAEVTPIEGAAFTAWDGYITGRNKRLEPHRRIVQSWRTTQFVPEDADSEIDVLLEPHEEGTKLTLTHSNVPDGHTKYRDGGWQDHYFEPMKLYFTSELKA
ncbi:MAG: SRPBCC domain-containing protein [Beijerinckiaceae bacterium]